MTISYNWLCTYLQHVQKVLPEVMEPERLGKILTSIGLEVESLEKYEQVKGGLDGVVIGKVITCEQHANADKLKVTTVNVGKAEPLQIVCGAPNVAAGQTVAVALVGTTLYPSSGQSITMKVAKIRGVESHGMICAEDELGLGQSHDGIIVLSDQLEVGTPAAEYFKPYTDWVYEIGLTPNRMDAMSHLGVAKDICAYITHHYNKDVKPSFQFPGTVKDIKEEASVKVTVKSADACLRYAGVTISGITIAPSPKWLSDRLTAIGVRPINNVVDITNYILHETGQPLHAFDLNAIAGKEVIVQELPEGTPFITLDEKERKLSAKDLMICNPNEPMCIAGVFGGLKSGVTDATKAVFLESACFAPTAVRKTSLYHGLRTDAATRFEKGVDIANTVNVLKRAALMIAEIAGGYISSEITDIYPHPQAKSEVAIKYHYLKKLSGKNYHPDAVKKILNSLGFEVIKEGIDELRVAVPHNKPDISLPADIVEEILRIDGLDNIEIPSAITISPAVETLDVKEKLREKIAHFLTGLGCNEIITNSITNSKYYSEEVLAHTVTMLNSLSAELDVLRPSMRETGLESIAHNINRKNMHLRFFEFGKTYRLKEPGQYVEEEHLAVWITGKQYEDEWRIKGMQEDMYTAKGLAQAIVTRAGLSAVAMEVESTRVSIRSGKKQIGYIEQVAPAVLKQFDIKQPVYYIDIHFQSLLQAVVAKEVVYKEVPKYPMVQRDLAIVIPSSVQYATVEKAIHSLRLQKLHSYRLFDVFESEKLGANKKSFAINFTFLDEEKTLTDKEIEQMMQKLMLQMEKELGAEVRK